MLTNDLKEEVFNHFTPTYLELLTKYIYKDEKMVRKLFETQEVKRAYENYVIKYFEALVELYRVWPDSTYLDELQYLKHNIPFKNAEKKYLELTGDETLGRFLHVYSYCVQEPSGLIYDKNYNVVKKVSDRYFSQTHANSLAMYTKFERDINEGNFWWLKNTATTLRRQLHEDIMVLSEKRFANLCNTYFERTVDVRKEFIYAVNGGMRLIPELDKAIEKKFHAKPFHCWWGANEKGEKILNVSENSPENGAYDYIAYHAKEHTRVDEKDNYYI